MQTMHPTLLIGPGDWDARQTPRSEYDERFAALWRDHESASGAIVYGDSRDHAALFYLTHFTPKLEAAIALIPRRGEARMLIGGGPNMLPAAKPLTFISALAPLRDAAKSTSDWARGLADGSFVLLGGDAMPNHLRHTLDQALGIGARIENGDAALQAHMRHKSPREVQILRESCATLDVAITALRDAAYSNKCVTDCILIAEHAALRRGAQDVRSLFSLDGGRTLRPFDIPIAAPTDPLQAYVAVRHGGYWARLLSASLRNTTNCRPKREASCAPWRPKRNPAHRSGGSGRSSKEAAESFVSTSLPIEHAAARSDCRLMRPRF